MYTFVALTPHQNVFYELYRNIFDCCYKYWYIII